MIESDWLRYVFLIRWKRGHSIAAFICCLVAGAIGVFLAAGTGVVRVIGLGGDEGGECEEEGGEGNLGTHRGWLLVFDERMRNKMVSRRPTDVT